jgi:purine-nucleoside phosphorylase
MTVYEEIQAALADLRRQTDFVPRVGLILGSGLGDFASEIDVEASVEYSSLTGFPVSTVPGHAGRFVFGRIGETPVVCMQGRVHYYEGYPMRKVVLPVRLMRAMGAEILFITNASGGIAPGLTAGSLMLIEDQISCFVPSPLIGPNEDELGTRFPDMSHIYDEELRSVVAATAEKGGVKLARGVYCQLTGPQFESPAEIRMLAAMGASCVGMSSACEAIAARHMDMRVVGVSCISNLAAGIAKHPLSHADVVAAADAAAPNFKYLVKNSIAKF